MAIALVAGSFGCDALRFAKGIFAQDDKIPARVSG
jgi:hypothetical protein